MRGGGANAGILQGGAWVGDMREDGREGRNHVDILMDQIQGFL